MGSIALLVLVICVGTVLYFLPWLIANNRNHQNSSGIFILNLLVGWTFIGWIAALIMACGEVKGSARVARAPAPVLAECSDCGSRVAIDAPACPRCGRVFDVPIVRPVVN